MRAGSDHLTLLQPINRTNVPSFDFHLHTTWTDGSKSCGEMYDAAIKQGLQYILFSEHARKTSGEWFGRFAGEVRGLPKSTCKAFVGVETKVADFQGNLDCTDEIISKCDLVMASVHRFPGEMGVVRGFGDVLPEEAISLEYQLASAALDNPQVDILGHPFGMCYRRYHVIPPDELIRKLIKKAAVRRIAYEVNCHYHPDPWKLIEWCIEENALYSLGSNAHSLEDVGRITRVLQGKEPAWQPSVS